MDGGKLLIDNYLGFTSCVAIISEGHSIYIAIEYVGVYGRKSGASMYTNVRERVESYEK